MQNQSLSIGIHRSRLATEYNNLHLQICCVLPQMSIRASFALLSSGLCFLNVCSDISLECDTQVHTYNTHTLKHNSASVKPIPNYDTLTRGPR